MHESEPQITANAAGGKRATNTIPCDQCDKLFKTVTTLKKHKNDKHVNVSEDIIDGMVAPTAPPVKAAKLNGSEEYIMIDSSLDEECIDGIGEPVIRPSKREARSNKKDAELGTVDSNGSEVHNDGSNVSTSSMSSRSSDIQDAGDVACLPSEPRDADPNGCRFESESTSASIRLSLSASEDDVQEASLCLNNLFDENVTTAHQDSSNQVNKERDQEMPDLNGHAGAEEEEQTAEGRDESDSQSVDSLDKPAVLKRKRPTDDEDEAAPETNVADADASLVKSSSKKTRLDDSASQQQPRSYLGKCIIL